MSTEAFRAYYENHHRLLGEKYLAPFASRYLRRYTESLPDANGRLQDPDFDVLLEVWLPDMAAFKACSDKLSEPQSAREIAEDEAQLFDRSSKRSYIVEEKESWTDTEHCEAR